MQFRSVSVPPFGLNLAAISICQEMVCKMLVSKLLGVVGMFIIADYAAVNGRCWKPCPPTWSQWGGKCYKMHDAEVTWEEGKQICEKLGGLMVVPQSEEELQHIFNMCSCPKFWIGCISLKLKVRIQVIHCQ